MYDMLKHKQQFSRKDNAMPGLPTCKLITRPRPYAKFHFTATADLEKGGCLSHISSYSNPCATNHHHKLLCQTSKEVPHAGAALRHPAWTPTANVRNGLPLASHPFSRSTCCQKRRTSECQPATVVQGQRAVIIQTCTHAICMSSNQAALAFE